MYYCTSSTYKRSAIGYAVSKNIEGPYTYVDTIVYSGFTKGDAQDANSTKNTNYLNTNIKNLMSNSTITEANSKWFNADGNYNTSYAPNAIDPELFYDKDGTLWMNYGSWSGGIYLLKIDKSTGKAIYPGKDENVDSLNLTDRYFGTRIAGGYNIRLFRSTNPNGPFVDAAGNNAALHGNSSSSAMIDTLNVELDADYTITGDVKGTWGMKDGSYYMNVTIDGVTYKGVFFKQQDESKKTSKVMTFTAVGSNNQCIWGSKLDLKDSEAVEYVAGTIDSKIPSSTKTNITLPTIGAYGTTISWSTNYPAILNSQG